MWDSETGIDQSFSDIGIVAEMMGIHPNTVRFYEEWGLITKPVRKENGYRIYTDADIRQLKIIRVLRCANYSLEAIRRMMQQLSENPDVDIRVILDTPEQTDHIISACDRLLLSLSKAEINAGKILTMLKEMKEMV